VDADGREVPRLPSTLGLEMPLRGPVPLQRVLDHVTPTVYALDGEAIGPQLAAALDRGEVFESEFAYTDGFERQALFLLKNDEGVFALVGRPTGFEWLRRDAPIPPPDDEDTALFDDDLDFGML
jgi:hypothetical protein